jgi:hypothetical protein
MAEQKFDRHDQNWVPDALVNALVCERIADPEMSDEERARKTLTQTAPLAAQSIKWLALYSGNESVRLRASQYIIDGVVGGSFKAVGGEEDLLMELVGRLVANDEAEQPIGREL